VRNYNELRRCAYLEKNVDFIGSVGNDDGAKMKRFRAAVDAQFLFSPTPHSQLFRLQGYNEP